jgi:tetratricopeptide (TPR) repeat protein
VDAENAARTMKPVYMYRVERNGSLASGSRLLGKDDGHLAEQKDDERGLRTQDALMSLKVLGVEMPEELYHEAFFSEPKNPAAILRYSRENQKLKPDPLLVELTPLLKELAAAGSTPGGQWESVSQEIRDLDYLRRRDRRNAYDRLGHLLLEQLDKLKGATRPRAAFGELTSALGVLAAIYRLAGRRDDAVELLALSWPLAVQAKNPFTRAAWFQKAAYLLTDLFRYIRAESFVEKAYVLYGIAGAPHEQLAVLVDIGYILTESGRHEESLEHLYEVLPRLVEIEDRYQVSAHHLLAVNHHSLGDLEAAKAHSRQAIALIGDNFLAKTYCLWRLGEQLVVSNELSEGFACFDEAIPLFIEQVGEPALIAKMVLSYTSILLESSYFAQLQNLDSHLSLWRDHSKRNIRLRTQIEDFRALIKLGELTSSSFARIRQQIISILSKRRG